MTSSWLLARRLPGLQLGRVGSLVGLGGMLIGCTPAGPTEAPRGAARSAPASSISGPGAQPAPDAGGSAAPTSSAAVPSAAPSTSPSAASAQPSAALAPKPSDAAGVCPSDMVLVAGDYCPSLELECLERRKPWQCARYTEPSRCRGPTVPMRYCIDRFEYPNRQGELPTVMNSWVDAREGCRKLGKRLCTEQEWTLACEGPERLAFPYGYVRDAQACAIDKRSPPVNEARLYWRATQADELARLDQREPSGARPACVSSYGVHDLTGNVDEWVVNPSGRPYRSSLKGGNWGEYRNACRPATRGHDEGFRYYQTGFRCCQDLTEPAR